MKSIKNKVWKILVFALVVTTTACGQQRGQRGGQGGPPSLPSSSEIKEMVSDLSDEISLNEEQETTIQKLYTEHFDDVKELTKSGRPDRDDMEALNTDFEKEVKAELTDEQQELFEAYQKKNRPKGRN